MPAARSRLLILGTGFAAFEVVKFLDRRSYDVTVVSRRNHFLFTPLLPSTTVGTVEFRSIIEPARQPGVRFYHAECTGVDPAGARVCCRNAVTFELEYDRLVIAVGAVSSSFGIPGVDQYAMHLHELNEARNLRQKILGHFETAALPGLAAEERARLLHFVVCGGGPTGVEFAAELHDLLLEEGRRYFPELVDQVRITLVEAGPDILSAFDAKLRQYAADLFRRGRIEVRTSTPVVRVEKDRLELKGGEWLDYGLLLWSAGNGPTELVRRLPLPKNSKNRILIDDHMRVPGCENVYAVGDCAATAENPLPETAQVAMKQGLYLAKALNRMARGKPVGPFRYHNLGMLAYLGGNRALADLPNYKGKGWAAWLFWRSAYLTRLLSIRTKIQVLFDWISSQIFGRDISRF